MPRPEVDPLARRYAPVVWIHANEKFGPAPVGEFLARAELTWRTEGRLSRDPDLARRGEVDADRLGSGCVEGETCYSHDSFLATDFTRPHQGSRFRPAGLDQDEGFYLDPDRGARRGEAGQTPVAPVFYERLDGRLTRILYWFFFPFSRPNASVGSVNFAALFSHEGDWENIEVILDADGDPDAVRYFGHGEPERFGWLEICKYVEGGEDCDSAAPGRPVVYSALFSHASYASAAEEKGRETRVCAKNALRRPCAHDLRNRGYLWDPLATQGGLRDAVEQAWYGFGGAWGAAGVNADTTGPLGPSRYKQPAEAEPGELESVVAEAAPGGETP